MARAGSALWAEEAAAVAAPEGAAAEAVQSLLVYESRPVQPRVAPAVSEIFGMLVVMRPE